MLHNNTARRLFWMIVLNVHVQGCGCKERFLNLAANFGHSRAEVVAGVYGSMKEPYKTSVMQDSSQCSVLMNGKMLALLGLWTTLVYKHNSRTSELGQHRRHSILPYAPDLPYEPIWDVQPILFDDNHYSLSDAFPPNLNRMTCLCRIPIAEGFILSEFHQWGTFKRSV